MKLDETNYVDIAEKAIVELSKKTDQRGKKITLVTTSKIRNLLAMTADIYNEVVNSSEEKLTEEIIGLINYLRVRFVYEAGREPAVKNLVEGADILEYINFAKQGKKQYILFSRYMEALVAFRKYYGGRDE